MWISRQTRQQAQALAEPEETTLQTSVSGLTGMRNERLHLAVPGGFAWRPRVGERLLVFKDWILGSRRSCPLKLQPGECCLYTDAASVHLTADGRIVLRGRVVYQEPEEE